MGAKLLATIHGIASLESHRRGGRAAESDDAYAMESTQALKYICSAILD